MPECLIKTRRLADGRPHADKRVHCPQVQAKRIAADIAGVYAPGSGFFDGEKAGPVRTAGAKRRSSARARGRQVGAGKGFFRKFRHDRLDGFRQDFTHGRDSSGGLSSDLMPVGNLHLDNARTLFDDQDLRISCFKMVDKLPMKGKGLKHLVQGNAIPEAEILKHIAGMGGSNAGNHNGLCSGGIRVAP